MVNQPLVKKRDGSFKREVPLLAPKHFGNGLKQIKKNGNYFICKRKVVLCDEFTNYYDVSVGIDAFDY
jgi:hypothetical protein